MRERKKALLFGISLLMVLSIPCAVLGGAAEPARHAVEGVAKRFGFIGPVVLLVEALLLTGLVYALLPRLGKRAEEMDTRDEDPAKEGENHATHG